MPMNDRLVISQPLADLMVVATIIENIENDCDNKKYLRAQAGYHLQQAAEKLIKIQLYNCGLQIRNDKIYKHSISELIEYGESIGAELIIPEYVITNAEIITAWEAEGRYDVHVVVRIDRIKKTYEVIHDWLNELKKIGYK